MTEERGPDGTWGSHATRAEARAAAKVAREEHGPASPLARQDLLGHPLFPTEPGERPVAIAWIQLRRYGEQGPVDHQRVWPASELAGQETIFQLFGGGVYEIWGRNALPNGQPGAIVKKRHLTLEGPSRPFGGNASQAAAIHASTSPASSGGSFDMFLHMMAEDRRESRAREERLEAERRAAEERRSERDEERSRQSTALLVQGLQVAATIVTAVLNRPAPPAPAPAPDIVSPLLTHLLTKKEEDPVEHVAKILAVAEKLHPKKGATESLPELLAGFGHAMEGIASVEQQRIEAAKQGLVPVQMAGAGLPGMAPTASSPPPGLPSVPPGMGPPAGAHVNGNAAPTDRAPLPQYAPEPGDDPGRLVS